MTYVRCINHKSNNPSIRIVLKVQWNHNDCTHTIASTPLQYRSHIDLNFGCPVERTPYESRLIQSLDG